jgi:mRNA interferase MazF
MPAARPGDVWIVDLGMAAKVRPCLILTTPPKPDELDVVTVVSHTTSRRGNRWEIEIPKRFLDDQGVFDVQRLATVASFKLERKTRRTYQCGTGRHP